MNGKFFIVVHDLQRMNATYRHATQAQAEKEAERLASTNPGKRFIVLEAKKSCVYNPVQWELCENESSSEDNITLFHQF